MSEGPCDSPAVRNRSIERSFYPKNLRTSVGALRVVEGNHQASILHSVTSVGEECVDLVADRFLVCHQDATIDLATGDRVTLVITTAGGISEQARWARRCERFALLHHRSIARLVDYGPLGEARRFEAWRSDGPWHGARDAGDRTRMHAQEFLRANAWSAGRAAASCLHQNRGRPVVVPDADAGFDVPEHGPGKNVPPPVSSVSVVGMTEIARPSVTAVASMFSDQATRICRTIAVCGPSGSGRDTAVAALARSARLNGYVPMASPLLHRGLAPLLEGRSVALLVRGDYTAGWRALLLLSLVSHRSHVVVFVGLDKPCRVRAIPLESHSHITLARSIVPANLAAGLNQRITTAARRARGLPGRFEALVWGEPNMRVIDGGKTPRAAESVVQYGEERRAAIPDERVVGLLEWPSPGELAVLRKRLQSACTLVSHGRHASGERLLRQVGAALARRRDWEQAARAFEALAIFLVRRGRLRDAHAALAEARESSVHLDDAGAVNRIAIQTGIALTDEARLDEAEAVLTAAAAAANGLDEPGAARHARLALARCQFWQGRFDAAAGTLKPIEDARLTDAEMVRVAALRSRVAVGRHDFEEAITQSAAALDRARRASSPELSAVAAGAAALAHLSVGDHAAVKADVAHAVAAARRCHDPLVGLRARLLGADSDRRQGRRGPGLLLCKRIRRLPSHSLPVVVRARVDLLADLLAREDSSGDEALAARHSQVTGLVALRLFVPIPPSIDRHATSITDIVSILQCCQMADDESQVLAGVCARLRSRLHAAGVGFFLEEGGVFTPIVFDGARVEPALAARVAAVDQPITPHYLSGRIEAGAPVRYGGRRIGVLLVRWSLGVECDSKDVVVLLATAATAAGPAVAAIVSHRAAARPPTSELLGISGAIVDVRSAIERAAPAPFSVLVEGESGTGKELVARALHRQSPRRDRPFSTLNCAALPDDLVESELFGHSRGAFTGAVAERPGVFEEAHSGTLFLDEIGELSLRAQAKVLRTVQEGELRRVGENIPRRIDVRLVAATNRDLRQEVAAGRFRLDLLYRLDVIRISLPPLRSRRDDIAVLAEHFWRDATARIGSRATLSLATLSQLARYDWPGNVRELQNVLAALAVRTPRRGVVQPSALPPEFGEAGRAVVSSLEAARRTFDAQFIRAALARTGGHRARAARELGVTRQGLTKLMVRLGLNGQLTP